MATSFEKSGSLSFRKQLLLTSAKDNAKAAAKLQEHLEDFLRSHSACDGFTMPGSVQSDDGQHDGGIKAEAYGGNGPSKSYPCLEDTDSEVHCSHIGAGNIDHEPERSSTAYIEVLPSKSDSTIEVPMKNVSSFRFFAKVATDKAAGLFVPYNRRRSSDGVHLAKSLKIGEDPGFLSEAIVYSTTNYLDTFVKSPLFDMLSAAAIASNAVFLGVQTEYKARYRVNDNEFPLVFDILQICFAAIFVLELMIRILTYRLKFFTSRSNLWWNMFDVFSVTVTLADILISYATRSNEGAARGVSSVRLLRIIRITRLIRVLKIGRIVRFVTALRELVNSIIGTTKTLLWALLLLALILYAFGILFTQAAVESTLGDHHDPQLLLYFGSVITSMFTLFKTLTSGVSWHDVVVPLEQVGWGYVVIFSSYVFFAYFAVLNVITSAFCSSAIASSQKDVDMMIHNQLRHNQKFVKMVCELFDAMDNDNAGKIRREHFVSCLGTPELRAFLSSLELDVQDATLLFDLLDVENSHSITLDQFVMGCVRLKGTARNIDMAVLLRQNQYLMSTIRKVSRYVDDVGGATRMEQRDSESPVAGRFCR